MRPRGEGVVHVRASKLAGGERAYAHAGAPLRPWDGRDTACRGGRGGCVRERETRRRERGVHVWTFVRRRRDRGSMRGWMGTFARSFDRAPIIVGQGPTVGWTWSKREGSAGCSLRGACRGIVALILVIGCELGAHRGRRRAQWAPRK